MLIGIDDPIDTFFSVERASAVWPEAERGPGCAGSGGSGFAVFFRALEERSTRATGALGYTRRYGLELHV